MINYGVVNFLNLVVFLAIMAVCLTKGGRYERLFAVMLLASWLVATLVQKSTRDAVPLATMLAADLVLLTGLGWIVWRYRPSWMLAAFAVQLLMVVNDVVHLLPLPSTDLRFLTIGNSLSHLQCACVLWGVIRRRVGPPLRLPTAERVESDARAA